MTIVYRKNLNRPMSWEELDGNFEEVEHIGVQSQQYANNASTSAASSASSASLAQQQVIVASGEADRAKSEADRASEITGVTTIAEAFIPFPDVWIPFSDSLRMLAGYGEDIKVGDETVATKATFSRATTATYVDKDGALKTAAINEPRFDKDGLLIEGQSTNLLPKSQPLYGVSDGWARGGGATWSNSIGVDGNECLHVSGLKSVTVSISESALYCSMSGKLEAGTIYTISAWVYLEEYTTSPKFQLRLSGDNNWTQTREVEVGKWTRISASGPGSSNSNIVIGSAGADISLTAKISCVQVESLPFVTSYIPTSGASATRAADVVTIPKSLNNCAEFYSGADAAIVTVGADKLTISPPTGKLNVRNFRGFFTPLTAAQKVALK